MSCRGKCCRRGNGLSKTLRQGQLEGQWVRSTTNKEDNSRSTRRGGQPGHRGPVDPSGIACLLPLESLLEFPLVKICKTWTSSVFVWKCLCFTLRFYFLEMLLADLIMSFIFRNSNKLSKFNWLLETYKFKTKCRRLLFFCMSSFSGVSLAACFSVATDLFPFQILLLLVKSLLSSFLLYQSLPGRTSFTSAVN